MLNVIFVSDNLDAEIGPNCSLSHQHFTEQVNLSDHNVVLLDGDLCTAAEVEKTISSFDGGKFILVAFSHGCEDALTSTAEFDGYVNLRNSYYFSSSLVYTNCCHSGLQLKQGLIDAGCYGFVGYTDEVWLPENEEDDILFIACENSALVNFINTDDTLSQSIEVMKGNYVRQHDEYVANDMGIAAVFLMHNLNCLTHYDSNSITRNILEN